MALDILWSDTDQARLSGACCHVDGTRVRWNELGARAPQLGCQRLGGAHQRPSWCYLTDCDPLVLEARTPLDDYSHRVRYMHCKTRPG